MAPPRLIRAASTTSAALRLGIIVLKSLLHHPVANHLTSDAPAVFPVRVAGPLPVEPARLVEALLLPSMLRHTSPADTAILVRIVVHCSIIATILLHLSEPVSVAVAHSHVISARHSSLVLPQCCVHAPTLASAAILMRINMTATAVPPHPKGTRMARITVSAITRAVHVRAVRVRAVIVHAVRVRAVRACAVHVRAVIVHAVRVRAVRASAVHVRASAVIVVHPHTLEPPTVPVREGGIGPVEVVATSRIVIGGLRGE